MRAPALQNFAYPARDSALEGTQQLPFVETVQLLPQGHALRPHLQSCASVQTALHGAEACVLQLFQQVEQTV